MQISYEHLVDTNSHRFSWDEMPLYHKDDNHEVRLVEIGDTVVTQVAGRGGWTAQETFANLPDAMCQSAHFGVVLKGRVRVVTKDGTIDCTAGDVYYQAVPHRVEWLEDSVLVEFSPRGEFWDTEVMMKG